MNQDTLGVPAVRIDGATQPIVELWNPQSDSVSDGAQMMVAECGGEPEAQEWTFEASGPEAGYVSNMAGKVCLDVDSCQTWITYGACNATKADCAGTTHNNKRWSLTSEGQLKTALSSKTACATVQADKTVTLAVCESPVPSSQKWSYSNTTRQLTAVYAGFVG